MSAVVIVGEGRHPERGAHLGMASAVATGVAAEAAAEVAAEGPAAVMAAVAAELPAAPVERGKKGGNRTQEKAGGKASRKARKAAERARAAAALAGEPAAALAGEPAAAGAGDAAATGASDAAALPARSPANAPDPNTIGIVFIHGIGDQRPGETLLSWGRALMRVLTAWQATTHGVTPSNDPIDRAEIDFSGASRPFVRASVPALGDHPAQTWVMTEAWWAARVSPPSIGEMFRWLVPREMIRLWHGIVSGIASEGDVFFRLVDIVFLPLLLVPLTAAVILFYVLFRVLRVIPWRPIQDSAALAAIQFFLVDWFGDVRVLLTDREQAANIRARVAEAITDCRDAGCGTIVLVGHSGGTIVGYMTLADEAYRHLPVQRFITHGQALGLAWRLGHADEYTTPDRNPDRLSRGDRLRTDLSSLPFRQELRWHDFWATHDPAPAGGFETGPRVTTPELVNGASIRVFNRMSLRNDHGAYWDNDEQFVIPVARLIDLAPDGAPATSRFFPESDRTQRVRRRRRRVKLLQLSWLAVMISAIAAVPLAILGPLVRGDRGTIETAGMQVWDGLARVLDTVRQVAPTLGVPVLEPVSGGFAVAVGVVTTLAAYWAAGHVMASLWTRWDERERQVALQPIPRWRSTWPLAFQLALCGGAALWLLTFAASGEWILALPSLALVVAAYGLGLITGRGSVRRPTERELDLAGVRP